MRHGAAARRAGLPALAAALAGFAVPLYAIASTVPLIGGKAPWRFNDWRTETDAVRGGASSASLRAAPDAGAEFSGKLDPSELKAASAGVVLRAELLPERLSGLRGLTVDLAEADGSHYSVRLKQPGVRAEYSYRFQPKAPGLVEMPFKDFAPMLRGRPAPQPHPPLDLDRVDLLTLQAESGAGIQEGPFALMVRRFAGLPRREEDDRPAPARENMWTCAACGTMNFGTWTHCQRCGESPASMEAKREARIRALAEAAAGPQKWTCGCGAKNFPSYSECYKCGAPKR